MTEEEMEEGAVTTVLPPWVDELQLLRSMLALAMAKLEPDPTRTAVVAWADVSTMAPGNRGLLITLETTGPVARLIPAEEGQAIIEAIVAKQKAGPLN